MLHRGFRRQWFVPFALTGLLVLAACGSGGDAVAGPADQDLTVALGALPSSGDPDVDSSLMASAVYSGVYDPLVKLVDGQLTPALATEWKSVDPQTWDITLREGVKFTDGSDWNATVGAWNLTRTMDPTTKSTRATGVAGIDSVEAVSPTVMRVHTTAPNSGLMRQLLNQYMKSEQSFESLGAAGFGSTPVGTGPFKVADWAKDEHVTLDRNDGYWGGAAKLKSITFSQIPDASTRMAQLQSGEADVVYEIPPEQAPTLESDDIKIVNVPLAQTLVLFLRNNQHSPLDDPRVRQAIAYGLDVDAIAKATLGDYAKLPVSGGIAVQNAFGYDPDLKAYPHDPAKAKQLLADAGYPNGFTVQFDATQGRYAKDRDAAQIVASQLAEVGITVNVNFMESGLYLSKLFSSALSPIFMMGQNTAPTYDNGTSFSSICSGPIQASNADPALCSMIGQQRTIFDDQQRADVIHQMDQERHDQAYVVQLYQLPGIYGISSKVQGLQMQEDYSFRDYLNVSVSD